MDQLKQFLSCMFGPRFFRTLKQGDLPQGRKYAIGSLESLGDTTYRIISVAVNLSLYTSPIILTYFYQKGSFTVFSNGRLNTTITNLCTLLVALVTGSLLLRGYGRYTSNEYLNFLHSFKRMQSLNKTQLREHKKELLSRYDFDFSAWPVEFTWAEGSEDKKPPLPLSRVRPPMTTWDMAKQYPMDLLSFVAVYTFGQRMMYPGSLFVLQKAMTPMLDEGRTRMIERFSAERFKLEAFDGNHIDTLVIDRRGTGRANGEKLVICCEGNAGFYEVGVMCTPIDGQYSVLGWNHPGFAWSTGSPTPYSETAAIDTVVKFAITRLGFKQEDIIMFAWSIGGFPCSWAAMAHPDIGAVILDATFDDIVPLATSKMPSSWKPLVVNTVATYFNLNISENLSYYSGPVLLIRRLKDEIIHTNENDPIRSNRANDILVKMLQSRFPGLFETENPMWALLDWLSGDPDHQRNVMNHYHVNGPECEALLQSYVQAKGIRSYPVNIGIAEEKMADEVKTQIVLHLANEHLLDFDSTHCTPLPRLFFRHPWDLFGQAFGPTSSSVSSSDKDKSNL